jgi:hypothetical protein
MGNHRRNSGVPHFLKYVGKFTLDLIEDFFGPIDWHVFFLKEIIGADIIQSACVVFMLMGKKYRIQMMDSFPDHLLSEVGTCIYDKAFAFYFQVDRTPQSFIPVIK